MIGFIGGVAASMWAANDTKGKDTDAIKMIYIGSAAVGFTGFSIDLAAGAKLKR